MLRLVLYAPGEMVICEGDLAREMYFLKQGRVEIFVKATGANLCIIESGYHFGEVACMFAKRRGARSATSNSSPHPLTTPLPLQGACRLHPCFPALRVAPSPSPCPHTHSHTTITTTTAAGAGTATAATTPTTPTPPPRSRRLGTRYGLRADLRAGTV